MTIQRTNEYKQESENENEGEKMNIVIYKCC